MPRVQAPVGSQQTTASAPLNQQLGNNAVNMDLMTKRPREPSQCGARAARAVSTSMIRPTAYGLTATTRRARSTSRVR
jgi:hypothetical protein